MIPKAAIGRLKQANKMGSLITVKHLSDWKTACSMCGKPGASWIVAILLLEHKDADFEVEGPLYLNGENYLVGSQCIRELRSQIGL
jgi:hypothetical protein